MISVSHLTKRYGSRLAVDDLSFEVAKGEVVGFLGPNGAGKSTTLRILAGYIGATTGRVSIAGHDIANDSLEARRSVGYLPESVPLYPEMRVIEYLRFRAALKCVGRRKRAAYVEDAMHEANVVDVAHQRIEVLSKGYRQRVGLADALLAKPPIVILDEPTHGLDPNQVRDVRSLVRELGREHAVVISTHVLSEIDACATRVVLIHRGRLIAEGPTDAIRELHGSRPVEFTVRGGSALAASAVSSIFGVSRCDVDSACGSDLSTLRVTFAPAVTDVDRGCAVERCVAELVALGIGVRRVHEPGGSLEDAFAELTREGAHETRAQSDAGQASE